MYRPKMENDPDLKAQEKILSHHPHHGFPKHGTMRPVKPHLLKALHREKKNKHEV